MPRKRGCKQHLVVCSCCPWLRNAPKPNPTPLFFWPALGKIDPTKYIHPCSASFGEYCQESEAIPPKLYGWRSPLQTSTIFTQCLKNVSVRGQVVLLVPSLIVSVDWGAGGGIPGIAGPGTQRRSRSPASSGLGAQGGRWGRDDHHRLGGDLEPGDGLVGRASYGPAAARSGREPVEPNSEERRRAAWQ